jgi:uncharacterized protein YegL
MNQTVPKLPVFTSSEEKAGTQVLPILTICDDSGSMNGDRIQAANEIIPALVAECLKDERINSMTRIALMKFGSGADMVLPWLKGEDVTSIPTLNADSGSTEYGAAFRLAKSEIVTVVRQLKQDGHKVLKPLICFVTDGGANDNGGERANAFAELTDPGFLPRPNILMIGVGEAQLSDIEPYRSGHGTAIAAKSGADAAAALRSIIPMIVNSVVGTLTAVAASGSGTFQVATDDIDDDLFDLSVITI